jgi:hypothetical protein
MTRRGRPRPQTLTAALRIVFGRLVPFHFPESFGLRSRGDAQLVDDLASLATGYLGLAGQDGGSHQ